MTSTGAPPLPNSRVKPPPTDLQSEQAILGALMTDSGGLPQVASILHGDMWADPIHQAIYGTITRLSEAGTPPTSEAVKAELGATGLLDGAGGTDYIAELAGQQSGASFDIVISAHAVRDAWINRRLINLGESMHILASETVAGAFDGTTSAADQVRYLRLRMQGMAEQLADLLPASEAQSFGAN